jgi:hypothetical protein
LTIDDRGALLVRTFFSRLFESELMPPGLPQVRLLIWTAALIYGPSLFLPVQMWGRYVYLAAWRPELLQPAIWAGKIQLLLLAMVPAGLIALVIWDGVFPDRRDAHILSVLPVPNRLLVAARLAALGLALSLIALSVALPVGLVYAAVIGEYQGGFVRAFVGHVVSSAMASAFVFCAVLAVQSVLVTIARGRWIHRLIVWGQFAAVVLLLQMMIFQGEMVGRVRGALETSVANPDAALLWAPPLWFLGLNETISGGSGDVFRMLAWRAVLMTAGIGGVALLLYVIGYRRLVRRALETQDVPLSAAFGRIARLGARLARPVSASRPVANAVFAFVVASFARSQRHRLLYGIYIGVGCAVAVAGLLHAAGQGWSGLRSPTTPLLSIPLVLTFLAVVGARVLFAIPVDPSANWVFRLTEPRNVRSHLAGARLALLIIAAGPPIALLLPIYAVLWGPKLAAAHAVYVLALAWLLVEIVMWRFARVPFTAPYVPGRANVRIFWPLYLMLFTTYAYTMAELESWLLQRPLWLGVSIGAIAATALLVSYVSARLGESGLLTFEVQEEEVTTLALSAPS